MEKLKLIPGIISYEPFKYLDKFKFIGKKYLTKGQSDRKNCKKLPVIKDAIINPIEVDVLLTNTETINDILATAIIENQPKE